MKEIGNDCVIEISKRFKNEIKSDIKL